jgi:hypothetical protein
LPTGRASKGQAARASEALGDHHMQQLMIGENAHATERPDRRTLDDTYHYSHGCGDGYGVYFCGDGDGAGLQGRSGWTGDGYGCESIIGDARGECDDWGDGYGHCFGDSVGDGSGQGEHGWST